MTERRQATAHRIYRLALVPLAALAVLVPGYHLVACLHDRAVAAQDFECLGRELERELAAEQMKPRQNQEAIEVLWSAEAAAKCHIRRSDDDPTLTAVYSTRAWEPDLMWQAPNPRRNEFVRRALYRSALAILPVLTLVLGMRRRARARS